MSFFSVMMLCPECGKVMCYSDHPWLDPNEISSDDMARVAHALCSCYVLSMPENRLGRLMASIVAAEEEGASRGPKTNRSPVCS